MSSSRIEHIDDIQKIQSFLIIISSPARPRDSHPPHQQILPRDLLEELHQTQKNGDALCPSGMAGQTLRKIHYKSRLNEKVQRHAQMKERCEALINRSPLTIRHASTGCLSNPPHTSQSKLADFEQFHQERYHQRASFAHGSLPNLPQLKVSPYELVLKCNGVAEKFYLFKTLKLTDKYCLYVAQNERSRTIYTLKMIKKREVRKEETGKLIRELKIQSYLTHVNLVKLLHVAHDNHFLYAFYEPSVLHHHNLAEQVRDAGPLFEREVRKIIKQICSAVDYMQRNSIVHQNIRPQSIYCQEGIVKLGNFSKAEHIGSLAAIRSKSQGSLKWPISRPPRDSKVDIWSIGLLAYELLLGRPLVLQEGISHERMSRESLFFSEQVDVSNSAKQFISACLERNPTKRLGLKEVMEHGFLKGGDKYRWTTA